MCMYANKYACDDAHMHIYYIYIYIYASCVIISTCTSLYVYEWHDAHSIYYHDRCKYDVRSRRLMTTQVE